MRNEELLHNPPEVISDFGFRISDFGFSTQPPKSVTRKGRLRRRCHFFAAHEGRTAASATQVPLVALFAREQFLTWGATNTNNATGGTLLVAAGSARRS